MKHDWYEKCKQSTVYPLDVSYSIVTSGYLNGENALLLTVYVHTVKRIFPYTWIDVKTASTEGRHGKICVC